MFLLATLHERQCFLIIFDDIVVLSNCKAVCEHWECSPPASQMQQKLVHKSGRPKKPLKSLALVVQALLADSYGLRSNFATRVSRVSNMSNKPLAFIEGGRKKANEHTFFVYFQGSFLWLAITCGWLSHQPVTGCQPLVHLNLFIAACADIGDQVVL